MLNVYFTIQKMHRGTPQESTVKLVKHRRLCSRAEAFADVLNTFGDQVSLNETNKFRQFMSEFATLLGQASAQGQKGAAAMVGDTLLCVSTLEGEECEVAHRGY